MKNLFLSYFIALIMTLFGCANQTDNSNTNQIVNALALDSSKNTPSTRPDTSGLKTAFLETETDERHKQEPNLKPSDVSKDIKKQVVQTPLSPVATTPQPIQFSKKDREVDDLTKKSQFFTFSNNVETVLQGREGIKLTIPQDCFETETEQILRGSVRLELKEFLKTSDMILAHLTTESGSKLLETGGMLYLNAVDGNDDALKIRADKSIKITLPRPPNAANKQLFYGKRLENGLIDWKLAQFQNDTMPTQVYTIADQNPEFPDGQAALFKFIESNLIYPKIAYENGIEGTVYVGFTVSGTGQITNVQVKKGLGAGCNEEAVRVIKKMPRWKPARNRGQRVSVAYTLPIRFRLENAKFTASRPELLRDTMPIEELSGKELEKLDEIENKIAYVMRTQRLGWLNCDRFLGLNVPKTDLVVWTNLPDAEVRLVLKNYRSIMSAWTSDNQKTQFVGLPVGEPIFVVATSPKDGKYHVSVTEMVISKGESVNITLKTVEKEEFLTELQRLDKINQ